MIEVPYFVEDHIRREFLKGYIKVTIHGVHGDKSGLTFKDDGYWYGLNKKIHIHHYLSKLVTYGKNIKDVLINDKSLATIDVLKLPKPEE